MMCIFSSRECRDLLHKHVYIGNLIIKGSRELITCLLVFVYIFILILINFPIYFCNLSGRTGPKLFPASATNDFLWHQLPDSRPLTDNVATTAIDKLVH